MIMGVDTAASKLHTVTIDTEGTPIDWTAMSPKTSEAMLSDNADVRRAALYREATHILATTECRYIFCEEPLALQNGKTTRILGLAAGAIWAAHLEADIDVFWSWANVAAWKKIVVGKGNASKEDVTNWSLDNGGMEEWEEDNHDAYAIATYGASVLADLDEDYIA